MVIENRKVPCSIYAFNQFQPILTILTIARCDLVRDLMYFRVRSCVFGRLSVYFRVQGHI